MKLIPTQRILPNGVKDEVRVTDGNCVKRVSDDYVIKANDIDAIIPRANYAQAQFPFIRLPLPPVNGLDPIQGTFKIQNWSEKAFTTAGDYMPNMFSTRSINALMFDFPLGTTLEQARTVLAGLTLTYQLARPKIYQSKFIY